MANETVIVKIEIDQSVIEQSKKRSLELAKSIEQIKVQMKLNTRQTDEQKAAFIEQQATLNALNKEYRQQTEVLKQANTITQQSEGSNNKLRAQLALLTTQYNGLSKAERENSDIGDKLKGTIRGISDELKKNESAIGDNRRNVGNYKEAFSSLAGVFGNAGGAIGGAANAAMGLNTAFKANPFIAVISILIPLIQQFLKLDSVAEKIESVMNAVSAAFKVTVGAIGDFIGAIVSGKGIISAFSDSFDDLGGRISEAAAQTYNLTQATKTLEDARRAQIVINAKDEAQIKNLLIQAKDRTKSVNERLELLYKASRIEQANFDEQVKLAKEEERLAKNKLALADKNASDIDELRQKAAEAEAAVIQLQSTSADLQEKIINRKNALLDSEQDALDKAAEKNAARLEKEKEARDKAVEEEAKRLDDLKGFYLKSIEENEAADKKAAEDKQANHIAQFNSDIELIKQRAELEEAVAENTITNEKDLAAKKRQIALQTLEFQLAALRAFFNESGVITEAQAIQLRKLEEQIKKIKAFVETPATQTFGQSIGISPDDIKDMQLAVTVAQGLIGNLSDVINAGYNRRLDEIKAVNDAEIAAIQGSTLSEEEKKKKISALNRKSAQEQYEIQLKQFKLNQTVQIAQAIANTASAVIAQLANPTPYAGFILSALAAVTGAAQIAVISAQKAPSPPSFATGGKVVGAGTGTSDSITAQLSNGESVNTAKTTEMFAPLLSYLNSLGGGVDWYKGEGYSGGGLVPKFAGGGVATQISNQAFQEQANSNNIANTVNQIVPVLIWEQFEAKQAQIVRTATNLEL